MTSKQRLSTVLGGSLPDRIPVYTQIPFGFDEVGFRPAAFHGYEDWDNWRAEDPQYRRLTQRMACECDNFFIWRPDCMSSDQFFVPPDMVTENQEAGPHGNVVTEQSITIGETRLTQVMEIKPGTGHTWQHAHYCRTTEDAKLLLELPYRGPPCLPNDFCAMQELLGDRGVMWVTVPSPILVVCRLFDPTYFLMCLRTDRDLIDRLMQEAQTRIAANLEALLEGGVGPVIRFGGAEHATPPMASPDDFDWLVVGYDAPLVALCKQHGCHTAVHCHGNLRHALKRFVEMGIDQTDPVEAFPDGDLSLAEARAISGDQITLTGNIQMKELHACEPNDIEDRIRQIMREAGPRRLVLSTTGTPLERMSDRLAENYNRFIDASLKWGKL